MSRYLLGTFLAALAMFVWGAVFWTSPLPDRVCRQTVDDAAAGAALRQHFPATGAYLVPGVHHDDATRGALHERGPLAFVQIRLEGAPVLQPKVFVLGFVHFWISTLVAAFLAVRTAPGVARSYGRRWWFFALVGVLVAVFAGLAAPIWWQQPWPYHLVNALYLASAWVVGGAVLAGVLKPPAD